MANYDPSRIEFILSMNVHEAHMWLAEDIDRGKLEAQLRQIKK